MSETNNEIRVTNVSKKVKKDLINIAKYNGLTLTQFLKLKFREIVDNTPEHMKKEYEY